MARRAGIWQASNATKIKIADAPVIVTRSYGDIPTGWDCNTRLTASEAAIIEEERAGGTGLKRLVGTMRFNLERRLHTCQRSVTVSNAFGRHAKLVEHGNEQVRHR